jgi:hypothetical protein
MCRLRIAGASRTEIGRVSGSGRGESCMEKWTDLADTGVANEEELEEVVVFAGVHGWMVMGSG